MLLVFAYTSFTFGFDAKLFGPIVTQLSNQFLPKDAHMELVIKATRSNCLKITCVMMNVMNDRDVRAFLFQ